MIIVKKKPALWKCFRARAIYIIGSQPLMDYLLRLYRKKKINAHYLCNNNKINILYR